ncbi:Uncharacterised protein [uncultured archaeon]|nr:Uncharacterised protein [uncultured archaeon]
MKPQLQRKITNMSGPAQLVHYESGKAVPGREVARLKYFDATPGSRKAALQELELFMLSHPGWRIPLQEIAGTVGISRKTIGYYAALLAEMHGLPPRRHGSKLPPRFQEWAEKIYRDRAPGERIEILQVIYEGWKRYKVVFSFDSARHLLKETFAEDGNPKQCRIGMWNVQKYTDVGALREKMNFLQGLEKENKLPWQNGGKKPKLPMNRLQDPVYH